MKNFTPFQTFLQAVLTKEEIEPLIELVGYKDTARKFTVYALLQYWTQAAFEQWDGFREGADRAVASGLPKADYSTFAKKAKDVPFPLFKRIFQLLLEKCNRPTRRQLRFPKELLLIDSTTITVGKTRLPWAPYHGERAGIKLHVAFQPTTELPQNIVETIGTCHDGPVGEQLAHPAFILVQDRAYGKIKRLDQYQEQGQSFVIRLKENVTLVRPHALHRQKTEDSPIVRDITCQLGTPQCR